MRHLVHHCQPHSFPHNETARVCFLLAHDHFYEGGFTSSVRADHPHNRTYENTRGGKVILLHADALENGYVELNCGQY